MAKEKSAISTFLNHILGDLDLIGKLAAFFGTILLISCVVDPGPVTFLLGLALVFLAIADNIWIHRDPGLAFPGQGAYYHRIWRIRCLFAILFFIMFIGLVYFTLKLPSVSKFLTTAGLGFIVPGNTCESDWEGNWQQYSQDAEGDSLRGSLYLEIAPRMVLKGKFTNEGMGKKYSGSLEGFLAKQGQRAEGIWKSEIGQQGKFTFILGTDPNSFRGTYLLEDSDGDVNQTSSWIGQKISR